MQLANRLNLKKFYFKAICTSALQPQGLRPCFFELSTGYLYLVRIANPLSDKGLERIAVFINHPRITYTGS